MKRILLTLMLLVGAMALYAADKPTFPGGDEALPNYLSENLKSPTPAPLNGIEGDVPMQFIVKADGTITSVKVTRMIDPDLEAEAIRLVKAMPAWTPATQNGTPVDATADITVVFRLPD